MLASVAWKPVSLEIRLLVFSLSQSWKKKSGKNRFLRKILFSHKWCFLYFLKHFAIFFPGNYLKWKIISLFAFHHKHLWIFWFSSYGPMYPWPIRLQDSLKCNYSRKVRGQDDFLHVDKRQSFRRIDTIVFVVRGQASLK